MLAFGFVGALAFAPTWNIYVNYHSEINPIGLLCYVASIVTGFFMQSVCLCIATITEGSLVKTVAHEREIEAKEKEEAEHLQVEKEKERTDDAKE